MSITTLGLILGYKCNIRCNSCLWGDRLESPEKMSVDDVKYYIDQGATLNSIIMVGFTGGEPTLFQRELRAGMEHAARAHAIPSGLSTNGSWAVSKEKADRLLSDYHSIGLRYLQLSVDDYHEKFVALERAGNCLTSALALGIKCTMVCVVSKSSRRSIDFLEAMGVGPHPLLSTTDVPCTPVGYASHRISSADLPRQQGVPTDFCSMLDVLNILPGGGVQTCCGAPFHMNSLRAGNLHKSSLREIVEDAEWNPVFNGLAVGIGPSALVKLLPPKQQEEIESKEYTTACDACHQVFSNNQLATEIERCAEEKRAEFFVRRSVTVQERERRAQLARSVA